MPNFVVLERGWLSSNNVVFIGAAGTAMVDTGYVSHSAQTLQLIETVLAGRALNHILNTHLHSDHCGGNAALQARYPQCQTLIPPGQAQSVNDWDARALSYVPTGQLCPTFDYDDVLCPGSTMILGDEAWEVCAAPGHDPHSVMLFETKSRTLISADALWENGFGVVFPELDGDSAFDEVSGTLDLIERLSPTTIIPGHGRVFHDCTGALQRARTRLDQFIKNPLKHAQYAGKVLLKYKLLELQRTPRVTLYAWFLQTPYFTSLRSRYFSDLSAQELFDLFLSQLIRAGAAVQEGEIIRDLI